MGINNLRALLALFLLTAVSWPVKAQEAVPWDAPAHLSEFKYFREQATQDQKSWDALPPEEQKQELENVKTAALERREQVINYYNGAMEKWDAARLEEYQDSVKDEDIKAVSIWLGQERGDALERKLSTLRALTEKARQGGLDDSDLAALGPYLLPDAIAGMKAAKLSSDSVKKPGAAKPNATGLEPSSSGKKLNEFAGAEPSRLTAGKFSKLYDGSAAAGGADEPSSGVRLQAKTRQTAAGLEEIQPQRSLKTAGIPSPPSGQPAAAAGNRSTAFTSDAYGITVQVSGKDSPLTFRKGPEAAAAIRQLPDGSITKVIFYGHGGPGLQTVGPASYDSDDTAALLKGKMAKGGVVQFSGCNTTSIGGPTLNPLVGLSMAARRLLYFSLPYFQDRHDGVPAAEAGKQWEKTWNADLARDTSLGLKGTIVCGYRTFGLVPGRLPGVTRLMGNQEATTPGFVAGKKGCYQDGNEVPAP